MSTSAAHAPAVALARQDCIAYEHTLRDALAGLFDFKTYSLYFPKSTPPEMLDPDDPDRLRAVHVPSEGKLLVPLVHQDRLLGVFMARGVRCTAPKTLCRLLPAMASLCLEALRLEKASACDAATGLAARHVLFGRLEEEVEAIRNCMLPAGETGGRGEACYRASVGLVCIHATDFDRMARDYGFALADQAVICMAKAIERACPPQALVARMGESRFAVCLPEATSSQCIETARALQDALAAVRVRHTVTDTEVRPEAAIGHACHPADLDGATFELPPVEQARILFQRATVATEMARDLLGCEHPMGFGEILAHGGRVIEVQPGNRLLVSLGRSAGAVPGQRFQIVDTVDPESGPKAEVLLMEVRGGSALAEIMHQDDPTRPIAAGDGLRLLREPPQPAVNGNSPEDRIQDAVTGLFLYTEFLARWATARAKAESFAMALVRLGDAGLGNGFAPPPVDEHVVGKAAALAREVLGLENAPLDAARSGAAFGGRHSLASLVFFHPCRDSTTPESLRDLYRELHERLRDELGVDAAVGIAPHPWLHYRQADAVENSRRALEYALWLDAPRVGLLDSMAVTIAADKRFSQGDLFGAIEEYKVALLADPHNGLARNSLGICLARLERPAEALDHFEAVLKKTPGDTMALYNKGYTLQRLGEHTAARDAFHKCLRREPDHVFALIRLGQLAEADNRLSQARKYYLKASETEGGKGVTRRYLARLALRQGNTEEAREFLHQALVHDPRDAYSLHLMARLYLDSGEDPELAETFARQSVALRPEQKSFWLQLARALEAAGKTDDARSALARASGL